MLNFSYILLLKANKIFQNIVDIISQCIIVFVSMKKYHYLFCLIIIVIFTNCLSKPKNINPLIINSLDQLYKHDDMISANVVANLHEHFADKVIVYRIRYFSDNYEVIGYIAAPSSSSSISLFTDPEPFKSKPRKSLW